MTTVYVSQGWRGASTGPCSGGVCVGWGEQATHCPVHSPPRPPTASRDTASELTLQLVSCGASRLLYSYDALAIILGAGNRAANQRKKVY